MNRIHSRERQQQDQAEVKSYKKKQTTRDCSKEDAIRCIREEVMEESHRGDIELDEGWAQIPTQDGFTPLYRSGAAVELFLQQQKTKGKTYDHVHAGIHGHFLLVPDDDMAILHQIRAQYDMHLLFVDSPAFQYFLSQRQTSTTPELICENVFKVDRSLSKEYVSWREMMKQQIQE